MMWAKTAEVPWIVDALVAIGISPGDAKRPVPGCHWSRLGSWSRSIEFDGAGQLRLSFRLGGVQRPDSNERGP